MYRKTGNTASLLPTDEKTMRCLTSFNFPQTLVLELKAQTAKEQRQINLTLANAKQSTIYRAKPYNEQIELHSMVTLQNPLETILSLRKLIHVLDSQVMPTIKVLPLLILGGYNNGKP